MLRALVVDAATAELTKAFQSQGIRAILLKGPAFARWLYHDEELRPYGDADLLVSEGDVPTVEAILRSNGYALSPLSALPGDFPRHARAWVRSGGGSVDLHTTLPGADADPATVWSVLLSRTDTMRIAGADVEVLAEPARAMMVALHAAKDGSRVAKVRHDLGHALERVDRSVWREAAKVASLIDATHAFASGLRLLPAGRALAEELQLPHDQTTPVALRAGAEGPPPLAVGIDWLLTERSLRRRASVVARKMFPPRDYLRASSALARRGRSGLLAAYVMRPFSMLARAIPASRAVWRARRRRL
ncbi:MAG: nucleotidyltransferase family protein [Polyangiales bacterium]